VIGERQSVGSMVNGATATILRTRTEVPM